MSGPFNRRRRSSRSGSAAILAVALILLLGFFGAGLMSSMCGTSTSVSGHVLAAQAYYIADAGAEWAGRQAESTTAPVTFGGGTFEVTADGGMWVVAAERGKARCEVRCETAPNVTADMDSAVGSRKANKNEHVEFLAVNNTGEDIVFDTMNVTWGGVTAYFEKIEIKIEKGTDYHAVWDYQNDGAQRWASGETKQLNKVASVTVPKFFTAKIKLRSFKDVSSGAGANVDMDATAFTIGFYNGATLVAEVAVEVIQ